MHKDIQLTKMDNAYEELVLKIQPLLLDHLKKHGQAYAAYAMQQLAVECSGRHLLAIFAIIPEDKRGEVTNDFYKQMLVRTAQLMDDAVEAGIAKRVQK